MILVCLSEGDWKPRFSTILDACSRILTDSERNAKKTACYFATSFIRAAINIPEVQNCIPKTFIPALVAVGDSKDLIDLYVVYASNKN